ncbi:MAG: glutathione S-transferase family protein [Burkholderiales bacterium]|jgi:glutathione S-transferase|nr:glutathione S-transferase family protein [Burkholderiales bacterium]
MLTLYHCISARSFRVLWLLEELRLPYDLRVLAFPPRAHDKSFLELNPRGTVPLLIDGETRMTESAAICEYLALRHSPGALSVGADEADFGAFLNYLHMSDATLTFPQTLLLRYSRFEPAERLQPQVVDDYSKWFLSRLRTLEPHLTAREFLCADRFTAADVAVGYALMLAELLELHAKFTPAVAAYWQRLRTREGFTRALRAQERAAVAQGVSARPATEVPPQL